MKPCWRPSASPSQEYIAAEVHRNGTATPSRRPECGGEPRRTNESTGPGRAPHSAAISQRPTRLARSDRYSAELLSPSPVGSGESLAAGAGPDERLVEYIQWVRSLRGEHAWA